MEAVETQRQLPAMRGPGGAVQALARMPVARQLGVMFGLAASVAIGVMVAIWSQTPSYSLLYGSLAGREASEVVAALEQEGIPFSMQEGSGAILVPSSRVHAARLKLASQGLPRGANPGFEVLERKQELGASQFIERARYQHALEVELARSIATLNSVRSTRVHLAVPKPSAFVRDRRKPTASVLVNLYSGRTLEKEQVAAIAHLVAASVPNLEPTDVKVVDDRGRLLSSSAENGDMALSKQQLEYAQQLEAAYIERIEDILTPILGHDRIKAQVVADVDFTQTEQTRESFNPDRLAIRSEQLVEERNVNAAAAGVPGALSNQPPPAASAPEELSGAPSPGRRGGEAESLSRRSTRNYEVERTVSHTRAPTPKLARLSAAVVVDDRRTQDEGGAVARTPRTEQEIERITGLVKKAIGFDAERGDTVQVVSAPFTEPLPIEPLPAKPLWKRAWVWDVGKQALAALFLVLLVFGVLRPLMRNLARQNVSATAMIPAPSPGDQEGLPERSRPAQLAGPSSEFGGHVQALKELASEDPKRMAQVVRSWVAEDE